MSILDSLCEDAPVKTDEVGDIIKELMSADWVPPGKRRLIVKACDLLKRRVQESKGGFGTELEQITVDDLKAVGLAPKGEKKPENEGGEQVGAGGEEGKIPASAAVVAPQATPGAEEEIPQSVIDATNSTDDSDPTGISKLVGALRNLHKGHGKTSAPAPAEGEEEADPNAPKHAEAFDEMGSGDYRQLMIEARRKKRS